MDLIRSELLRIRSRRVVRVLGVLALTGSAVGVTIAAANSHPGSQLQLFSLPDILRGTSFIVFVIGVVIGGSSVGADWQHGTMAALLTWEPRRVRIFLTRAVVVMIFVFVFAVVLQIALSLMLAAGASLRGDTGETGGAWLREVAGVMLRVGGAAAFGATLGVAIAMIGRNTGAALGVVFGYLFIAESLLRGLLPKLSSALISTNAAVFIDGRTGTSETGSPITVGRASLTLALYSGALLIAALALFRTRDVT
jgi:ABC-type transport system involved in multi-copper enzyme maturation permease subunit